MEPQLRQPPTGLLTTPVVGEVRDGRGEFCSQERFDGRAILTRFVITVISPVAGPGK